METPFSMTAVPPRTFPPDRKAARAAFAYAREIAGGDDARFALLFWSSYHLAQTGHPNQRPVFQLPLPLLRSYAALLAYPAFVQEARARIEEFVAQPLLEADVVGVPVNADPPDCVILRPASATAFTCSAVILGPKLAVTAAHCLSQAEEDVTLFTGKDVSDPGGGVLLQGHAKRHPNFQTSGDDRNDIAVIHLSGTAPVNPAPRAFDAVAGEIAFNAGYGFNDQDATQGFGVRRTVAMTIANLLSTKELIAGPDFATGNLGSQCAGDSGGPLYVARNGFLVLAAITSRRIGAITCGAGGKYTLLADYKDFLGI